jgi:ABC-2 type transport system permease protein
MLAWKANVNLVRELAVVAFKLKYTGSVLGYVWSLVKPLMIFGMMYLVFAVFLLRGRPTGPNFPVQLLLAIVVWGFFSDATVQSVSSIAGNGHMIQKAYFPRWTLVVASTLSAVMTLVVNVVLLLIIGLPLGWFNGGIELLLFPVLLAETYVLVLGIGLLLSALFTFYRDLGHVWEILLQMLFYVSAVVFPFTLIPARFQKLIILNPTGQIVQDLRHVVVNTSLPSSWHVLGMPLALVPPLLVLAMFAIGAAVFNHLTPRFAEAL